jgi:ABC-type Fe3+ transport system permease subunit
MMSRGILFFLILATVSLFVAPYIPLWDLWTTWDIPWKKIIELYAASTKQALLSVLLTTLCGAVCASGLMWMRYRFRGNLQFAIEYAILLPSILPSLFVIISVLSVVPHFPLDMYGVVIVHALSMMGFCGVLFVRLLDDRLGQHAVVAKTLGSSGFFFIQKMFPLIARDLWLILSVLFFYFLTSISIPLVIGGTALTSVEKMIYDQVVVHHDWNTAIEYFLLQLVLLLPMFVFAQSYSTRTNVHAEYMRLCASRTCVVFAFLPTSILLMGLMMRLLPGLRALGTYPEFYNALPVVLVGSMLLGFVAGGVSVILLCVWTLLSLHNQGKVLLRVLCVPSVTMVAFGFSLWSAEGVWRFFYSAVALAIIFVPFLFRLGIYQNLQRLQTQIESARQMGANTVFLYARVVLPQLSPNILRMGGLSAVWSMSDFAVSRVILERDWSLGLWIQSLVQQYRWDVAVAGCWLLIVCGFIVFSFFWRVARVSRQKFI